MCDIHVKIFLWGVFFLLVMNANRTNILDISFDVVDFSKVISEIIKSIKLKEKFFIVTANPEIVMLAQKDLELKKIIDNANLVVADGIGIVLASKLNKIKIKNRIAGYDLVQNIFMISEKHSFSVLLLK